MSFAPVQNHIARCRNCSHEFSQLSETAHCALRLVYEQTKLCQLLFIDRMRNQKPAIDLIERLKNADIAMEAMNKKMNVNELQKCYRITDCTMNLRNFSVIQPNQLQSKL